LGRHHHQRQAAGRGACADQGAGRAGKRRGLQIQGPRPLIGEDSMRALALVLALIASTGMASAAELDAMMTTAMKAAFDELLPAFERANGHVVRVTYGPSGALLRRFEAGEPADLFATD